MKIILNELLDKKDITMYWLAKEINVSYPCIFKMCRGTTSSIDLDILEKICLALDCTPNDILAIEKN